MLARLDLLTRFINAYSNRYLEHKIYSDLKKEFELELRKTTSDTTNLATNVQGLSPIILLGMHRSGTTLVSKLLRESGIYMGYLRGKDTDESLFFQNVNKAIYKLSGASWDDPDPFRLSLQEAQHRQALTSILSQYCSSPNKTKTYLSADLLSKSNLFSMPQLWGWKDPRTCFSLPLWLKIFPKAKIIYIQRNGVDVAQSLVVRNKKIGGKKLFSPNTADLAGAFKLWEKYNDQCLKECSLITPDKLHIIKYEDLLINSEDNLEAVFDFLDYQKPLVYVDRLVRNVETKKAFAFTKNNELIDFYKKVRDSQLMKKLGYDNLL